LTQIAIILLASLMLLLVGCDRLASGDEPMPLLTVSGGTINLC